MHNVPRAKILQKEENIRHMSIESVTVESIMTKDVKTAKEDQTVKVVASMMSENSIGSIVVTKRENIPLGIITERDIVRIAGATELLTFYLLAGDIMSKPIITIEPRSSIQDAIQSMKANNIRRLLVVDGEGKMIGILTDKDIFKAIINSPSLVTSVSENITIENRPIYERLSQFMMEEILLPGSSNPN
jgi:CBS domain-containing protein